MWVGGGGGELLKAVAVCVWPRPCGLGVAVRRGPRAERVARGGGGESVELGQRATLRTACARGSDRCGCGEVRCQAGMQVGRLGELRGQGGGAGGIASRCAWPGQE